MPDDPRLGEFRADFANLLGTIEEYPQPASGSHGGFAGAIEIVDGEEMWKRLSQGPGTRVDARAFLNARLLDVFMGDWDRHLKQWRFIKRKDEPLWLPLAEDRDQAFARFDGLLLRIARSRQPRFVRFGPEYPSITGATFNGWDVDRRLLAGLEKEAWDEAAAALRARLTDAVIDEAVQRMPAEYQARDGARLEAALLQRRERIAWMADRYYRHLAREASVQATDQPEWVEATRQPNGDLELRIGLAAADGGARGEPYFRRRYRADETDEVRVYLHGGDDGVVSRGEPGKGPKLRVIAGEGFDTIDDSNGGGTRVYDSSSSLRVTPGPGTSVDPRPYEWPTINRRAPWTPPRDWGRQTIPLLWLSGGTDLGAFLGAGVVTQGYGFRKHPYADRQLLRGGYATSPGAFRFEYEGEFRRVNSRAFTSLGARASGIEILRFYGFGNETSSDGPDAFFKVRQQQYALEPALSLPLGARGRVTLGPTLRYATTELPPQRFISSALPYGVEDFGQAGLQLGLHFDTSDVPAAATRGVRLFAGGGYYPALLDVRHAFGSVRGEASAYHTARGYLQPTLALRAGGKRVFGTYPFHEAAFVGGGATLRGFRAQRFAGDGSLYGSAELRVFLTDFFLLFPGELGVFALADGGRVFLDGESSDRWHTSVGGGIWLAFLDRSRTLTAAVAHSKERTAVYLRAGFAF
jgi:hypothetical protein